MNDAIVSDLLFITSEHHPDVPALGYAGEAAATYREVASRVDALSAGLRRDGIEPGDRVAIVSENMPNWGIAYLAINRCGAVVVPVLPEFPALDVSSILEHAGVAGCFATARLSSKLADAGLDASRSRVYLLETLERLHDLADAPSRTQEARAALSANRDSPPTEANRHPGDPDDLAAIIYTSGTTGHSKGVMLTNRNLVFDAQEAAKIPGMRPGDAMISILPLAHTYECTIGFLVPLSQGCSIYYLRRPPSATVLMPALKQVRPHLMLSVPLLIEKIYRQSVLPSLTAKPLMRRIHGTTIGRKLLNRVAGRKLRQTFGGRLYFFGIGGAALAPEVEDFLIEAGFPYCVGYGLTETSPLIAGANAKGQRRRSTGPPIGGIEVKIAETNPQTGEGEILVRGPIVMKGYYHDPDRTAEVIDAEGWFHTGDLGLFDDEGRLYIKGRAKNMILGPSGENIYPEAIESIINSFEYVEDSVVFQEGDELLARIHVNYDAFKENVQRVAGAAAEAAAGVPKTIGEFLADVRKDVNSRLSSFSRIGSVIEQEEPFEKTPTNKIKRFLYSRRQSVEGEGDGDGKPNQEALWHSTDSE